MSAGRTFPQSSTTDFIPSNAERLFDEPRPTGEIQISSEIQGGLLADLNGDGIDDITFSTTFATFEEPSETVVVFGRSTFFNQDGGPVERSIASMRIIHEAQDSNSTRPTASVVASGDFNNDGYADLVLSGSDQDNPAGVTNHEGRVYVVFGGDRLPSSLDLGRLNGTNGVEFFSPEPQEAGFGAGFAVGDFNGDGVDDLAVSAPQAERSTTSPFDYSRNVGATYIIFGSDDANAAPGQGFGRNGTRDLALAPASELLEVSVDTVFPQIPEAATALSGADLEVADLNGDGVDDLVISGSTLTYYDYDPNDNVDGYYIRDPRLFVLKGANDLDNQASGRIAVDAGGPPGSRIVTISNPPDPIRPFSGMEPSAFAGVDFDGDGIEDLALVSGDGFVVVFGDDGKLTSGGNTYDRFGNAPYGLSEPDRIDIGAIHYDGGQLYSITPLIRSSLVALISSPYRGSGTVADVNLDGLKDLLIVGGPFVFGGPPADSISIILGGSIPTRQDQIDLLDGPQIGLPTDIEVPTGIPSDPVFVTGFDAFGVGVGNLDADNRIDFVTPGFVPDQLPANFNFGEYRIFAFEPRQTFVNNAPTLDDIALTIDEGEDFGIDLRPGLGVGFVPPDINIVGAPNTIDPDGDLLAFRVLDQGPFLDAGSVTEATFGDGDPGPLLVSRRFGQPADFDRMAEGEVRVETIDVRVVDETGATDEATVTLTIEGVGGRIQFAANVDRVQEGDSGTQAVTITATRFGPEAPDLTFNLSLLTGIDAFGTPYADATGVTAPSQVTFAANQTVTTFDILVKGDQDLDGNEAIGFALTPAAALPFEVFLTPTPNILILDDDGGLRDDTITVTERASITDDLDPTQVDVITGNVFADNGSGADVGFPVGQITLIEFVGTGQTTSTFPAVFNLTDPATGRPLQFTIEANGDFEVRPEPVSPLRTVGETSQISFFYETDFALGRARVDITINGLGGGRIVDVNGSNLLVGGPDQDTLFGLDGPDRIEGREDFDFLFGGEGNDTLLGGSDAFGGSLDGGPGNDLLEASIDQRIPANAASGVFLDGGEGDDTLNGARGGDSILGGPDNDSLSGNFGRDTIEGGAGNDTIEAGPDDASDPFSIITFDESVVGGAGHDHITTAGGSDSIFGGEDNDTIISGAGLDQISGGRGDDEIRAGADADIIFGDSSGFDSNGGNDTIFAGPGEDVVEGGFGDDSLLGEDGNDFKLDGGEGNDTISGGEGTDGIIGGSGRDSLSGGIGNDTISGGFDADIIEGGDGADSIDGGDLSFFNVPPGQEAQALLAPDDTISGGAGSDTINGGRGADSISGGDETLPPGQFGFFGDSIFGDAENDTIFGDGGNDSIDGGDGDDSIDGGADDDTIIGGADNDTVKGGPGDDSLFGDDQSGIQSAGFNLVEGGPGNDTIGGGDRNDTLNGGADDDEIEGGHGDDLIDGGSGNDRINQVNSGSNNGRDTVDGGTGNDTLTAFVGRGGDGNDSITVGLEGGLAEGGDDNDTLLGVGDVSGAPAGRTTLRGGDGDDEITGFLNVFIEGGDGADRIRIPDGLAIIDGGAGNDTIEAAPAGLNDRPILQADGGAGDDSIVGGSSGFGSTLSGGIGADTIRGGDDTNTINGGDQADSLVGGDFLDTIRGGSGADTIEGGDGEDELFGEAGRDSILGGAGRDSIDGGSAIDTIDGGPGADTIDGGPGNDVITTGTGADVVIKKPGESADTITDFDPVNDRIDISAFNFAPGQIPIREVDGGTLIDLGTSTIFLPGVDQEKVPERVLIGLRSNGPSEFDGTPRPDTLTGTARKDVIRGRGDNDTLLGDGGHDEQFGGNGADLVKGNAGDDRLRGGDGADTLVGNGGTDRLNGDADADTLRGGPGSDTLIGGPGDDSLNGGPDGDVLSAGPGSDSLFGGFGEDTLRGGEGPDQALGGAGDDEVFGGGGADLLRGNESADRLSGGAAADVLVGGSGEDSLRGGDGDDTLRGGTQDDTLNGGAGADRLMGETGRDALFGLSSDDTLLGGAGRDILIGGDGEDRLIGGTQADRVAGNGAADAFVLRLGDSDPLDPDTIVDFSGRSGEGDQIDLSAVGSAFIGDRAFNGVAGEVRADMTMVGSTRVEVDVDGDGDVDIAVELLGSVVLDETDFVF